MTGPRARPLFAAILLLIVSLPTTGCTLVGAITGAALHEPEITTDLIPPRPNTLTMITFDDGKKQKARFVRFESMSQEEYTTHFDSMYVPSLHEGLPNLGDRVEVTIAADSSRISGRFAGYSGFQHVRFRLFSSDGNLREWPLYDLQNVRSAGAAPVNTQQYRDLARVHALPTRSVYVARFNAETHTIPVNDISRITKRVRLKRALIGAGIGFLADTLFALWVAYQYPGEICCFD